MFKHNEPISMDKSDSSIDEEQKLSETLILVLSDGKIYSVQPSQIYSEIQEVAVLEFGLRLAAIDR